MQSHNLIKSHLQNAISSHMLGQNGTIVLFTEIYIDLPLFCNMQRFITFWVLEFHELNFYGKILKIFNGSIKIFLASLKTTFFKELEFMKLELYDKLKFHKLEFQKDGRLLNILQVVVCCKIFCKRMIFGHFGLIGLTFFCHDYKYNCQYHTICDMHTTYILLSKKNFISYIDTVGE